MLKNALIFVVFVLSGFALVLAIDYSSGRDLARSIDQALKGDQEHERAKSFQFTDLNGTVHSLHDFEGKIVILNFWASWCPPCVKEFPDLIKIAGAYPDDVVLIALSSDFEPRSMNRFLSDMRVEHPNIYPSENILIALDDKGAITRNLYHIYKLPETHVISPQMDVTERIPGANWAYADMDDIVQGLLVQNAE